MKERIAAKLNSILLLEMGIELNSSVNLRLQKFDSLDFVEFIMYVERDFKILILNEDLAKINTIDDLIEIIKLKIG